MQLFTDEEWEELPHIRITHEADWDPEVLDNELSDDQDWFDSLPATPFLLPLFDEQGVLRPHMLAQQHYVQTLPLGDNDSMAILTEDKHDIHESTGHCVYYANLHRMIPVDHQDISGSGSDDTGDEELLPCVTAHKAHLVTLPILFRRPSAVQCSMHACHATWYYCITIRHLIPP